MIENPVVLYGICNIVNTIKTDQEKKGEMK